MATALLATKLTIPPAPRSLVRRPRLLDRLDHGSKRRLTLVSAPAGCGKTTLLAEWVAAARLPAAWVSLDERDNDPQRFWTYVVAALGNLRAGPPPAALPQAGVEGITDEALPELINEVTGAIPGDFLLVLDDYHLITNPALHRILAFLLDYASATMHVVIASREDPPLPLGLLRARDQLVELRAGELSFTASEAAAFLRRMVGVDLPAAAFETLQTRSEGWVVGLQLAALSMREGADPAGFVETFRGTHRYVVDYLAEQVLQRQDPGVQRFLLETSILERLSAALCEAVTGEAGGQAMLERLERANLFLVPLDSDRRWYRYHQLFAGFMQDRLRQAEPGRWRELQRSAARWFEQQGEAPQAFEHWVRAGDMEEAVRLAAETGRALLKRGEVKLLLNWMGQLPGQAIRERPWLGIYRAWALAVTGQFAEAEECLRPVEQRLAHGDSLPEPQHRELLGEVAAIRAYRAVFGGQGQQARALAQVALEHLPPEEGSTRSVVYLTLGITGLLLDEPGAAAEAYEEAVRVGRESGNLHGAVPAAFSLSELQVRLARLREAMVTLEDALRLGMGPGAQPLSITAEVHAGVAEILLQWNDLEAAARYGERAIALSRRWGLQDAMMRSCHSLLWVYHSQGQVERAGTLLQDAEQRMRQRAVLPQTEHRWAADRMRWWIEQGQYSRAAHLAEERGLSCDAELTHLNEGEYIELARLLLARREPDEALRLLGRLLQSADAGERINRVIEILALQALALQARGESAQATRTVVRALGLAEPGGYVRVFVEGGAPMAQLLQQVSRSEDEGLAGYAGRLLAAFGQGEGGRTRSQPSALIEPLSERELQILRLIAAGKTYQEVARELIIAVSTVQTYVRSLYPKLGVHSGLEAVARARQLGLLPP